MRLEFLSYLYLYKKIQWNTVVRKVCRILRFFSFSPEESAWSSVQHYSYEILLSTCFTPIKVRGELDLASPVAFPTSVEYWFIPAQIEMSAAESA